MSPGSGRRYSKAQAAAAADDPGRDVQEFGSGLSGFGGGEFAVQQEEAGPGEKVEGREAEFDSGGAEGEAA